MPHAKPFKQANQNFGGRLQVVRLKNRATPLNKHYHVRFGWRPDFVFYIVLADGDGDTARSGFKADGTTYADGTLQIVRTNGNQDEVGGLMDIEDYGVELGANVRGFRVASREVALVCFGSERGLLSGDLGSDTVVEWETDQKEHAFDYPSALGDALPWLFVDP